MLIQVTSTVNDTTDMSDEVCEIENYFDERDLKLSKKI